MKLLLTIVIASVIVASGFALVITNDSSNTYQYVPSDIAQANLTLQVMSGHFARDTTNPSEWKEYISDTVIGTVLSVGDLIPWIDNWGYTYAAVPVTIQTDRTTEKTLTFYLHSLLWQGEKFVLLPDEAQFEIGEKVMVHLGTDPSLDYDKDALYMQLGQHGKYKIVDEKAYNIDYPEGRSLDSVMNESK